jgi:hypothetical protein
MRIAIPIAMALAGGATAKPPAWVPAEGTFVADKAGFEVDGPPGWMRFNPPNGTQVFTTTRDGTALQRIVAGSSEVGKPLGLGESKRTVAAGMSTAELGELVMDDLRAGEGLADLTLLENAPARVAGYAGFKVDVAFRDRGLKRRATLHGFLEGSRLYWLYYVAPERHYYAADLATFDKVVASFRLRGKGAARPPPPAAGPPSS